MPPSSSISSSDPARAWALALGAVVLVEALVAAAVPVTPPIEQGQRLYLAGRTPTFDESVLQWQLDRLWRMDAAPEALVIGDSSALIGLIPSVIEERTGLPTQSLATIAHLGVHGQAEVLEAYLERRPPPRVVVAQFGDWSLVTSDADADHIGMYAGVRTWLGRDDGPVTLWPSHRLRAAARRMVGGAWYQPGTDDEAIRAHLHAHQGHVRDPTPTDDWATVERPRPGVHPDAAEGLVRLLNVAREAGAALLLVHPPLPAVFDSPEARAGYADTEARVRTLLSRIGHGQLMTPFAPFWPTAAFSSLDHLTGAGARRHSEAVAARLGAQQ